MGGKRSLAIGTGLSGGTLSPSGTSQPLIGCKLTDILFILQSWTVSLSCLLSNKQQGIEDRYDA